TATSGTAYGVYGQSASTTGTAVHGEATATTGTVNGVAGKTASSTGRGVYGYANAASGVTTGVYGQTASPTGRGILGLSTAATGPSYGVYGNSISASGIGIFGLAGSTSGLNYGVYGRTASTGGVGIYGVASGTTGTTTGGLFETFSPDGTAIRAYSRATGGIYPTIFAESMSADNGVIGGWARSTTGQASGGIFVTEADNGTGLEGHSESTVNGGPGPLEGGYFTAKAPYAVAIHGVAQFDGHSSYGVTGEVYTGNGYGVWAIGQMGSSGTKTFRIDHPFDPENRYLIHYSAEGPEPQNIYNGVIKTDSNGKAWVTLPDYFEEINKDPRYQLTVVDDSEGPGFVQVKVAKRIKSNRFLIMTSAPNIEVSWEVKAVRNDRWVRKYGAKVEVEKPQPEKGKYLNPETSVNDLPLFADEKWVRTCSARTCKSPINEH
ncbi:MAG: hypothetical protein ABL962_05120, partial [Fimbriimonadaceae bacterium]